MIWDQTFIELAPLPRGFHLVTNEIIAQAPELTNCEVGLLHLFIQHTSASLAVNENADPDVRGDLERHFNVMVPENAPYYEHVMEGPDEPAGPHQEHPHRPVPDAACKPWPPCPGYLAGGLPVRAPGPGRWPPDCGDTAGAVVIVT